MPHLLIFASVAQVARWATSLLTSLHGACIPITLVLSFTISATARAELIINDAVFAHNFDSISGDTITALTGPNAIKTSNLSASSDDPVGFGESQHVRALIRTMLRSIPIHVWHHPRRNCRSASSIMLATTTEMMTTVMNRFASCRATTELGYRRPRRYSV